MNPLGQSFHGIRSILKTPSGTVSPSTITKLAPLSAPQLSRRLHVEWSTYLDPKTWQDNGPKPSKRANKFVMLRKFLWSRCIDCKGITISLPLGSMCIPHEEATESLQVPCGPWRRIRPTRVGLVALPLRRRPERRVSVDVHLL